jgi:hypothetical protein
MPHLLATFSLVAASFAFAAPVVAADCYEYRYTEASMSCGEEGGLAAYFRVKCVSTAAMVEKVKVACPVIVTPPTASTGDDDKPEGRRCTGANGNERCYF